MKVKKKVMLLITKQFQTDVQQQNTNLQLTPLHLFLAYDLLTSNKSLLQKILVRNGNRQLMQPLQPILL
jgi:hypothetical protein